MSLIHLRHCSIEFTDWGVRTFFDGGKLHADGSPHQTPHYHVISHRLGYGDDVLRYAQEHEFFHSFVEQEFHDRPSRVLYVLAQGRQLRGSDAVYEEVMAQTAQRWVRANERPIVSGCNWDEFRAKALEHLSFAAQ